MSPNYLELIDPETLGRPGTRCRDITPIFGDVRAFEALLNDLLEPFEPETVDAVVGIDALGFILATALAVRLKKGLVPLRKGGKLPVKTDAAELPGRGRLELRADALAPGTRVLVADDWIRTGAHLAAAVGLVEQQGGVVAGVVALNLDENEATRPLAARYRISTVLRNGAPRPARAEAARREETPP